MLVLNRREGETIVVGDSIRITVIEVRRNGAVRLGIEAPEDIRVDREEIRRAIERGEKRQVTQANGSRAFEPTGDPWERGPRAKAVMPDG